MTALSANKCHSLSQIKEEKKKMSTTSVIPAALPNWYFLLVALKLQKGSGTGRESRLHTATRLNSLGLPLESTGLDFRCSESLIPSGFRNLLAPSDRKKDSISESVNYRFKLQPRIVKYYSLNIDQDE